MSLHRKMHKDEIEINDETVEKLVSEQFPQYADLPIHRINSSGTVNVIYRLGDEYCVRLPRLNWAGESLQREWEVLPIVSKNVEITVPEIIEKGRPNSEYPLNWAIYRWIQGHTYDNLLVSETETAEVLAQFIRELHSIQIPHGAPRAGRKPLRELNKATVTAITECDGDIDVEKALEVWYKLLNTEQWDDNPVWIHSDLLKPNLIVNDARLSAIIDFGSSGVGDPAFDVVSAWTILTSETRELFRSLLDIDDNIWLRAKAYALHQAALIIPYYRETNPAFVNQAKNTISNIL